MKNFHPSNQRRSFCQNEALFCSGKGSSVRTRTASSRSCRSPPREWSASRPAPAARTDAACPAKSRLRTCAVCGSSSRSSALPRQAPLDSCTTSLAQSSRNVIGSPPRCVFSFTVCGRAALDADRPLVLYWVQRPIGKLTHSDRGMCRCIKISCLISAASWSILTPRSIWWTVSATPMWRSRSAP